MVDRDERRAYWNERYAADTSVFGADPNVFVEKHLSGLSPRRVLDLGCGQGRNAIWLAQQGHDVTAVDHSDVAVEQARRLAERAAVSVQLEVADIVDWEPDPEAFDVVLLAYLQLEEDRRTIAHRKAAEAVAPGGTVFLIAHHADNLTGGHGGPDRPEVLFTPGDLDGDFAELDIERNEAVLRAVETADGPRTAIDLLMIARKPPA